MVECKICGSVRKSNNALGLHISKAHNISTKNYYDLYIKLPTEGICKICGKQTMFYGLTNGYVNCCSQSCSQKYLNKNGTYDKSKQIPISSINEELRLIENSDTDYITPTGKIYQVYNNGMCRERKQWKLFDYMYCRIKLISGYKDIRVHREVAKVYIPNPNNYPIVMHKDNNKSNNNVNNLLWGTISQNTKDGIIAYKKSHNGKSYSSGPIHVYVYDTNYNLINEFKSKRETAQFYNIKYRYFCSICDNNQLYEPLSLYFSTMKNEK